MHADCEDTIKVLSCWACDCVNLCLQWYTGMLLTDVSDDGVLKSWRSRW